MKANPYRKRVLNLLKPILEQCGKLGTALDFGAGDGWFAYELNRIGLFNRIVPIDVAERKQGFVPVAVYREGHEIPFGDRSFNMVYAIDVLHHCGDPAASLKEMIRCASRYLLIKDHTYKNAFQKFMLGIMDETGNKRFGVPCNYKYQREWSWFPIIENAGFTLEKLIYPAKCHTGPLGLATNKLQFIALWKRG
jgi:SAM-dependent methyltransferase